ncbi:MAG: type II secretion system minor pseudopilin GspK [bacterium]|nr:type II secretion system minor pseudopilin GspK [bacterium]MDP6241962.1 type II secretion system minor pseudopilin GspK [Myxococcota bacterium]MDP7297782.1 type II secretion system minor pseudopilin GspK [Myxococcota bacterium]HJO23264.1 type II secretion system minor pseudopilin GspK [Myxococcota bacterium]
MIARRYRRRQGVVLLVVLFFALLLTVSVATFLRRATVDSMVTRNREDAAQADALARGGVRLAHGLLVQDRLLEQSGTTARTDRFDDLWAIANDREIELGGGTLRVSIEDAGARLNLNALLELDDQGTWSAREQSEAYLNELFEKWVDELPLAPGERALYEPRALAGNLLDWMDSDEVRAEGGFEDDFYEIQEPPYRAANGPLLSLDELRLIEGFDGILVDHLRHYVTVYPWTPGGCGYAGIGCGINLNTAAPHVLALLFYDDGVTERLATEDLVRGILRARDAESGICGIDNSPEGCTPITDLVVNPIFPPPSFISEIFVIRVEARMGDVTRTVETVVDRSGVDATRVLSWQIR